MSKYTTGEMARLCHVSVRTVQYYDDRGILVPSELSDGGRRLYTDDDLKKMRIICFLREVGISINGISALFKDDDPYGIISLLLKELDTFSVESIDDIARVMKQRNKLTRMRLTIVLTGIPVTALQWTSIILWITSGLWYLLPIWACVAIPWGICVTRHYFNHVAYICPECHRLIRPKLKESFWAYHTPKMRRLTCPSCGRKGLCARSVTSYERRHICIQPPRLAE